MASPTLVMSAAPANGSPPAEIDLLDDRRLFVALGIAGRRRSGRCVFDGWMSRRCDGRRGRAHRRRRPEFGDPDGMRDAVDAYRGTSPAGMTMTGPPRVGDEFVQPFRFDALLLLGDDLPRGEHEVITRAGGADVEQPRPLGAFGPRRLFPLGELAAVASNDNVLGLLAEWPRPEAYPAPGERVAPVYGAGRHVARDLDAECVALRLGTRDRSRSRHGHSSPLEPW